MADANVAELGLYYSTKTEYDKNGIIIQGGSNCMVVLLIICIMVGVLFYGVKIYCNYSLQDRCTGKVIGHFVYCEWVGNYNGRFVQTCWNPVFEYQVEDTLYMMELEIMAPSDRFDLDEVEVQYLPSNPEICFIKGTRGKLRSKTNLEVAGQ